MMLDLGSIGKGYALDLAADILRDAGVENALLHGGTSTIIALGAEPGTQGWKVAIENPYAEIAERRVLSVVDLRNESMSVSAVWGKFFEIDGKRYGHVIDPRTGWPAEDAELGAVILKTATATDALSTAVLLGSEADLARLSAALPEIRYLRLKADQPMVRGIELSLDNSASASV
jgi:FAD:protein FMN transferase